MNGCSAPGIVFAVFPHRQARLRVALARCAACRHPARFRPLKPPSRRRGLSPAWPARASAPGRARGVALLAGCVQSVVFGDVNAATARVLAADGYDVHVPTERKGAAARCMCMPGGSRTRGSFQSPAARARAHEGYDYIAVNAAGCRIRTLGDYGHLLAADPAQPRGRPPSPPRCVDISELLTAPGLGAAERRPLELRVAASRIHATCATRRGS